MHMPYGAAAGVPQPTKQFFPDPRGTDDLLSPTQIDRLIRRESLRADRNGLAFSVVMFRCQRGRRGGNAGSARAPGGRLRVARLVRVLARRARLIDEIGWFDADHLCAVLPDTGADGARVFAEHVCDLVARRRAPRPRPVIFTYPAGRLTAGKPNGAAATVNSEPPHPRINGNGRANGHGHTNGVPVAVATTTATMTMQGAAPAPFVVTGAATTDTEPLDALLVRPLPRWKRVLDVVGTCGLAVGLAPVLLLTAVAVKLTSHGPVIYKQRRAGLGGRPFTMYKFRSMIDGADAMQSALRPLNEQDGPAFKMTNDPRLTPVGRFIRKTSIDELPQLWNVLRGEMSLVGPRPLPLGESDGCAQWQRHRLEVTPGLTCIWQVDGRSCVTFAEWVAMDLRYVRARSLWRDLSILVRTVPAVLWRRGAR